MRTVLLGVLFLLKGAICTSEYIFNGVIRHFAVGNGMVFVATDTQLYQMQHDLVVEKSKDITNTTHRNAVRILLPFEANGTLITCGTSEHGHCEVLNISDITQTIYREMDQQFVLHVNESSVAFLVDFRESNSIGSYILVGKENEDYQSSDQCVSLLSTLQTQPGEIFSETDSVAESYYIKIPGVKWVDGFQAGQPSQLQSYLFANVKNKLIFLKMDNHVVKSKMVKSLKVATLECCSDKPRRKLVSSTFIFSESSLLWMGIFTAERPYDPENTVLAVYNITDIRPDNPPDYVEFNPHCKQV